MPHTVISALWCGHTVQAVLYAQEGWEYAAGSRADALPPAPTADDDLLAGFHSVEAWEMPVRLLRETVRTQWLFMLCCM